MKRVLSPQLPTANHPVELPIDEAKHLLQVFRMKSGDVIEALDGQGKKIVAEIEIRGSKRVYLHFKQDLTIAMPQQIFPLTLEIGILKAQAMEWVIEKCVELGVDELVCLKTKNTVIKVDSRETERFQQRWQKIADQALKQCGRLQALKIHPPVDFGEHLTRIHGQAPAQRLWCDEATLVEVGSDFHPQFIGRILQKLSKPLGPLQLVIGPEGGFAPDEQSALQSISTRVNLGPLTFRAETAALYAISITQAFYQI